MLLDVHNQMKYGPRRRIVTADCTIFITDFVEVQRNGGPDNGGQLTLETVYNIV
eukprot:m.4318 g.4318  ORF g.4318 m.4318 type:complete len:54 (+) comp3234_c0_seq1:74-235(+)